MPSTLTTGCDPIMHSVAVSPYLLLMCRLRHCGCVWISHEELARKSCRGTDYGWLQHPLLNVSRCEDARRPPHSRRRLSGPKKEECYAIYLGCGMVHSRNAPHRRLPHSVPGTQVPLATKPVTVSLGTRNIRKSSTLQCVPKLILDIYTCRVAPCLTV